MILQALPISYICIIDKVLWLETSITAVTVAKHRFIQTNNVYEFVTVLIYAFFLQMVEKEGYLQKAKIADGGKKLR